MATFAVVENNLVTNVIVADTLSIAQEITGKTCIEYNDSNTACIGWTYNGEKFISPKPEGVTWPPTATTSPNLYR